MKKLLPFIILLFPVYCFAIEYTVFRNTSLYDDYSDTFYRNSAGNRILIDGTIEDISAGETVFPASKPDISHSKDSRRMYVTTKDGVDGWINSEDIFLSNNEPLPEYITNTDWIYSFYQDIILKGYRESLFKYEPFWKNEWGQGIEQYEYPGDWWKIFYITYGNNIE